MPITQATTRQLAPNAVNRDDVDITTTTKALLTKAIAGTNITLSSTGIDAGTGDVTINFPGTLIAGTATTAPLNFTPTSAILKTTAAAGNMEVDANSIFYTSQAASSRGIVPSEQFMCLSANYALTDTVTAQKAFNSTTNGAITLQSGITYYVEGLYQISSTGTTNTHTWGALFAGTATFTSAAITYMANASTSQALRNVASLFTSAPGTVSILNTTQNSATEFVTITFRAILRINAGGTIIPQVKLSAVTGAAPTMFANSFIRFIPWGSSTVTSSGNWS